MSLAIVLLIMRIASALLLLSFLGAIIWLAYRDLGRTRQESDDAQERYGYLRVAVDEASADPLAGMRYPLRLVNSIGRAPTNTIVLDDDFTSNEHALLTLRGRQWWLTDLNSRNGTLVNGVRLTTATVVSVSDVIKIGDITFVLEAKDRE